MFLLTIFLTNSHQQDNYGMGGTFSNCQVVNTFVANQVLHWSDGLVPVESAVGYPGAQTETNPYPTGGIVVNTNGTLTDPFEGPASPYLMPRSNHQQMRNDPNTKVKMKKLLDGGFGGWFYVEED